MRIAAVLIFIVECWLSHQGGKKSGEESRWLARATGIKEKTLRRMAHVLLFLALSVCTGLGFGWQRIVGVCIWSVLDEVTKIWVRGRHCSALDIGLNLLGTGIGLILYVVL